MAKKTHLYYTAIFKSKRREIPKSLIKELFHNEYKTVKTNLSSYSFDDTATLKAMKEVYSASGYILDPHKAIGYLGLKASLAENKGFNGTFLRVALVSLSSFCNGVICFLVSTGNETASLF